MDREEQGKKIILGGDFNARTGNKGGKIEDDGEEERKSKDGAVNAEGKEMIEWMKEQRVYIVNGNCKGDEEGEYTYIEPTGRMVIDYVLTNRVAEENIEEVKVKTSINSDHQPIKVRLINKKEELQKNEERGEEVVRWTEENMNKMREELKKDKTAKNWKELKEKLKKAQNKTKQKKRKNKNQK